MGSNPINLFFRFILELCTLTSVGVWGWNYNDDNLRFIIAPALPIILAIIWGTFAVPNYPSRSGNTPIKTPDIIRLILELGIFTIATWTLYDIDYISISYTFGVLVVVHYIISSVYNFMFRSDGVRMR